MKKLFYLSVFAIVAPLLGGCYGKGSSAPPPSGFSAVAGDGRAVIKWMATPGVDYWIFSSTDPNLTAYNWDGLANPYARASAATPFYMCGLIDTYAYYFAANGRIDGGPGGPSTAPIPPATPYNASDSSRWNAGSLGTTINGVGYTSLTTCGNNAAMSSTGVFAAVGAGGAIFTSHDGQSWILEATIPTALYAVAGYAAHQNNALTPGLRWMAVGAAGTVVNYLEGTGWVAEDGSTNASLLAANPGNQSLRSMTRVGGRFYVVGDAGTIISSGDGTTWASHVSNTTSNLNGITHGTNFVAVGDSGTILTSPDGNTWTVRTPAAPIPGTLRQVAAYVSNYGKIYVAVGDAGTIVTSIDGGVTWITQAAPAGSPDLVGIAAETRAVDLTTAVKDPSLKFISTVQFVAIDRNGNAYTSLNGYDWTTATPFSTGISCTLGTSCFNPLVSSGFGYLAAGDGGVSAYAF